MDNIFEVTSPAEVHDRIDEIRAVTDARGFSLVRGLVPESEVARFRRRVTDLFDPAREIRVSGEYRRGMPDFQRLDLGEYPSSSRFARYYYFFSWNDDRDFKDVGHLQMSIFNRMTRQPATFGFEGDDDPSRYRATFVIQYPIGGGFMSKHREYSTKQNDKAYVVYLALTTRGVDYHQGGAYVYVGDELVDIDALTRASDIVIYRGDLYHGVFGVDHDLPVELGQVCGRMILTTQVNYLKKA